MSPNPLAQEYCCGSGTKQGWKFFLCICKPPDGAVGSGRLFPQPRVPLEAMASLMNRE